MAERKTFATKVPVDDFIDAQDSEQVRDDCRTIAAIMEKATRTKGEMWGTSIIGFGRTWWTGAGGKQAEWPTAGFSPRKANLTVYLWPQFDGKQALLAKLGKHSTGKGCLYIKRLSDVHVPTLKKLIEGSVKHVRANPPSLKPGG
jgi:hypothetical protein